MTSILNSTPYHDSPRLEMLKFVPELAKRVLDVGCHTGAFGKAVKAKCSAEVWGVEPNETTAAVARHSLDKVFNTYFDESLELPNLYFDAIVFNDVLEHISDPWDALRLASKKIQQDGVVIISVPNFRHIDNILHVMKEKDFRYEDAGIRDRTHLRFFTFKSAPRIFDNTGLRMEHIEGVNEEWYPSPLRRLASLFMPKYLRYMHHVQIAMVGKISN